MFRILAAAVALLAVPAVVLAHHGFGGFDPSGEIEVQGTITGIDFVNPHAYLYLDAVAVDGTVTPMRCEMRAATVLRRSGWSAEMFVSGAPVSIAGRPHRADPASCYIDTMTIGDAPAIERYEQFAAGRDSAAGDRPYRRPSGEPNIAGDWAQEQYLLARSPGGRGALVPKSMVDGVESGQLSLDDVPDSGWGARPVTFSAAGLAAREALRNRPPEENPRMRCEVTSILFDWVFDGPINRITQEDRFITFEYGRGLTRAVDMTSDAHPGDFEPRLAGHSIGRWDGDTLVVETIGFLPGSLVGDVVHSDQLRVVERFTLDPDTLTLRRDYVAEDPLYFTSAYTGSDRVLPADAPFEQDPCEELAYRNYAEEAGR